MFVIVVVLSLGCLLAAAFLALRLIWITAAGWAWTVIAASVLLMVLRRAVMLFGVIEGEKHPLTVELVGLGVAILLLVGIGGIAPVFRAVRKGQKDLERMVAERTSELAAANDTLRAEIAQREKAEEALAFDQQQLRSLLEMYERDRKLVAYEIHDGFVQQAVAALMNLQTCQHLGGPASPQAATALEEGRKLVVESIAQARWLISGLRPAILDDLGLLPAVEQMVSDARERTGRAIEWSQDVPFERLPAPLETGLFRIIQESLNNALGHSGSPRVRIELSQDNGGLHVTVQDWGCGFDPTKAKQGHFGVEGIRERARLFGGEACVESAAGQGTRILVTLPLPETAQG